MCGKIGCQAVSLPHLHRNAVAFQKQKKAKPEEIPSVRDVVLLTDLHGEKGVFSLKASQLVIAQVTCCNQIAEFSARRTT
jgi:hypothetical protein